MRGIITMTIGCVLLLVPGLTMQTILMILGGMLCLNGVVTILLVRFRKVEFGGGIWSVQGIINVVFGLPFLLFPDEMVKIFAVILGFLLLMMGLIQFMAAIGSLHRSFLSWIFLTIAILTISGGIYLFTDPFKSAETILSFLGIILILNGISELFLARKIGQKSSSYQGAPVEDITYEEV